MNKYVWPTLCSQVIRSYLLAPLFSTQSLYAKTALLLGSLWISGKCQTLICKWPSNFRICSTSLMMSQSSRNRPHLKWLLVLVRKARVMVRRLHVYPAKLGFACTNSKTSLAHANHALKLSHVTDRTVQRLSKASGDRVQQVWIT